MIARALHPGDVIHWPRDNGEWTVVESRPVDPERAVDGPWRLAAQRQVGPRRTDVEIQAADLSPEDEFLLVGWVGGVE